MPKGNIKRKAENKSNCINKKHKKENKSISMNKKTMQTNKTDNNISNKTIENKTQRIKKQKKDDFDIRGGREKRKKYTEDGFPIYSMQELCIKFNPIGTDDCPFDCDCCT